MSPERPDLPRPASSPPVPTAELHVHLEGTLEPELILELADRNGLRSSSTDVDDLRRRYRFEDLQSFLDLYYENMTVLRVAADFADMTGAYLERARRAGVRHAEVFVDPQAHTERGVPLAEVMDGVSAVLARSQRDFGISAGLIVSFLRDLPAEQAMRTLDGILQLGTPIIGVGLDSAEAGNPPGPFAGVFGRARAEGLMAVAHAGEEGPPAYIWEALDELRAVRIDHGVRCLEDARLVERLVADAIPLTVCPLSNLALRVVPSMAAHPLPAMLSRGLTVTVNSDDPAYFGGYVDDNYDAVVLHCGLEASDVAALARNSAHAAVMDPADRRRLLVEIDGWLEGTAGRQSAK